MMPTSRSLTLTDTVYLSNVRFDSVYVSNQVFQDRSRDTVFIRQHDVEYRYRVIRDTVERIKIETVRDSIPYEVRVVDIKEVPRKRTWFDKLCYCCFGILLLLLGFKLFKSSLRLF